MWRPEDEALLQRLEDEAMLERLFAHHVGVSARVEVHFPHPRAAGLVAIARTLLPADARDTRDVSAFARVLETAPLVKRPPALLHHLALYFGAVADALETISAEAAANARVRSLAAWLALAEEEAYVAELAHAVAPGVASSPRQLVLDAIGELGRRAEGTSRDLGSRGRAALLSLAAIDDVVKLAGVGDPTARSAKTLADKSRAAAVDAALHAVGEAFDDASARGDLMTSAPRVLSRLLHVWHWSARDEAVEHFAVDRLGAAGWELYRARRWDALRELLEPFRPMIEHLAHRIETDPGRVAYAAACAQMFVFLSDVATDPNWRLEHAEHAVKICPAHRNGRLVLAALLCDEATTAMRTMMIVARKSEIERVEGLVKRAESLYPASEDVKQAKTMLERAKKLPAI